MNPKSVGELSEISTLQRLITLGWSPSIPFGNNQRYDVIVERDGHLYKCQVKTGRIKNGVVVASAVSKSGGSKARSYLGEIDIFLVWCPDNNKLYWVPPEKACKNLIYLRLMPAKIKNELALKAQDFEV